MRFDLEIPVSNVDITFIPEGRRIPSSVVPLYHINIDHKYKLPSDFIMVNENVQMPKTSNLNYQLEVGPTFVLQGDKFAISHITKYNSNFNTRIPLFYKHTIVGDIQERSVRLVDYFGVSISDQEYLIEKQKKSIVIFLNKYDRPIYVEHILGETVKRSLVSYSEIFTEISWDDLILYKDTIPNFKYQITDTGTCKTSYAGNLYIKYNHENNLIRKPISNIKDSWNISILGTSFWKNGNLYSVPEYHIQNSMASSKIKLIKEKKCKIIHEDLVQLQSSPDPIYMNNMKLFIYDYYSNELKHAITTDKNKKGSLYKDKVFYDLALDWNTDGYIQLPVKLTDKDIVFATYYIREEYYEFRLLNFNNSRINHSGYYAFYMKPNVTDMEFGIYYCKIGSLENNDQADLSFWRQGRNFESIEQYNQFISDNSCFHIGYVSLSISSEFSLINGTEAHRTGGHIENKRAASNVSKDIILEDLKNKNLHIPMNDALIARVSLKKLIDQGLYKFDSLSPDEYTKQFIDKVHSAIQSNTDVSTKIITEIDLGQVRKTVTVIKENDDTVVDPTNPIDPEDPV